jgi:predicted TIM-barrel fold metal-dependent hydrolase
MASNTQFTTNSARLLVMLLRCATASISSDLVMPTPLRTFKGSGTPPRSVTIPRTCDKDKIKSGHFQAIAKTRSRRLAPLRTAFSLVSAFCAANLGGGCHSRPVPDHGAGASSTNPAAPNPTQKAPPPPIPKIDVHLHVHPDAAGTALEILAENGIVVGLNASGGEPGLGLETSLEIARRSKGRLLPYCNLSFSRVTDPDWTDYARGTLERCKKLGAKGLKVSKYLGLGLTDASGALVPVDDARLDVVFEMAGKLGLPVLIHSADPKAFFQPNTPQNERYDELRVHPSWSFYGEAPNGRAWPSWQTLLEQLEARIARHPATVFVGAHFGNAAEEPERVARMLSSYPNYFIDTAARVPEFGRHAADRMRQFFIQFQDRVLFGSDLGVGPEGLTLGSGGELPGTRAESRTFFDRHWSYFETRQKQMQHPTPIQGRWTVDGIGLPREVLEKLYFRNAARVFGIELPPPTSGE